MENLWWKGLVSTESTDLQIIYSVTSRMQSEYYRIWYVKIWLIKYKLLHTLLKWKSKCNYFTSSNTVLLNISHFYKLTLTIHLFMYMNKESIENIGYFNNYSYSHLKIFCLLYHLTVFKIFIINIDVIIFIKKSHLNLYLFLSFEQWKRCSLWFMCINIPTMYHNIFVLQVLLVVI